MREPDPADDAVRVRLYHRPDDPWSHLLLQRLGDLQAVYRIALECITVPFPDEIHAPRPAMLAGHALRDARDLSAWYQVDFPSDARIPPEPLVNLASRALLTAPTAAQYLPLARALGDALFSGDASHVEALCAARELPGEASARARLAANYAALLDAGHYLSGMLECRGVWYWGIDRLSHLEHDLLSAGRRRPMASVGLLQRRPCGERRVSPIATPPDDPLTIDWFCSFRSPYSYLAAERTFALARRHPVRVRPRLIIPMKMAGFTIPDRKRDYFRMDPAREALRLGLRFGNFCDPFGPGLERAMAAVPVAEAAGRLEPYVLSVMTGVWADGIDTGTDEGLRRLVERAGLDWSAVRPALDDDGWRGWADRNREELAALGQYAAPTWRIGDWVTWGQDRLWMIEERLRESVGTR